MTENKNSKEETDFKVKCIRCGKSRLSPYSKETHEIFLTPPCKCDSPLLVVYPKNPDKYKDLKNELFEELNEIEERMENRE